MESPSVPAKKPRLSETNVVEHSPVESTPVILGQPVTLGGVQPPGGEVDDPLNDSHQYEQEEEGEMEEGIDFNHLKTEPIQVYSGYDDSHHSDMMHESMGEGKEYIPFKYHVKSCRQQMLFGSTNRLI